MTARILIVEDDPAITTILRSALKGEGYDVTCVNSLADRDRALADEPFGLMITDVMLGDGDGIATLDRVHGGHPSLPVIILSAQNTLDTAVRASDTRAFEYFPKPFDLDDLSQAVRQAIGASSAASTDEDEPVTGLPLVGRSQPMQMVYRMIARVLRNTLTVLITGESGTGKELVAEAIHQLGDRKTGPFVAVNAAAIPADLIESELFGHEKGAFTGAVAQAIGKFEQANGGTLFLDEIGDMPIDAQTRLLRALQSGRIRRVGGRQDIAIDVRIVAATNRDLMPMIEAGAFREDLFYRLNVVPIHLPPLRERRDDIAPLAKHFLTLAAQEGLPARQANTDTLQLLSDLEWRGNVRELRNIIFRLVLLARSDVIDVDTAREVLAPALHHQGSAAGDTDFGGALQLWLTEASPVPGQLHKQAIAAFEKPLIEYALKQTIGNQLRAAELLGINRNTLRKRIFELDIVPDTFTRRP